MPRHLHPGAWWLWAVGLGVAATRTTNPVLLLLVVGVAGYVVAARRGDAPWSRAYGTFLKLGLFVLAIRMAIQVVFGQPLPGHVLFTLPSVPAPRWLAGIRLGGPVTAEAVVAQVYDGLRLGVLLACVGAANALASPYRLLRALPGALYEAGVAVTVALSFAPQALVSAQAVREARRLRGRAVRGPAGLKGVVIPVLEGALTRSVALAASMDARGYGRSTGGASRGAAAAMFGGLLAVSVGTYGLLDSTAPAPLGFPAMALGALLLAGSLVLGSRRSGRSRYRPDVWRWPEWVVVAAGLVAPVVLSLADDTALHPSTNPLAWPAVPLLAVAGIVAALAPAFVAPRPPASVPRMALRTVPA
ncbi:MAG TPA: CbiQ family ECF transporter T component [Frankiaceae bacterium]|jgi:energy-coupling factor transport system permease protein|nr:CbiQ family ECF transporter T component [Frankiaceae bacterium]